MTSPRLFDMLSAMKRIGLLFTSAVYAVIGFSMPGFETYELILDRMPFGAVADTSSGLGLTSPDERKLALDKANLARQVNMSAMRIAPDGRTEIGFTDLSAKPPVNYYLAVGDSDGGWTVLDADYGEETAKLTKDGIEIDLKYGQGLIEPPPGPGGRAGPGFVAANAAVNAASLINATPTPVPDAIGAGRRPPVTDGSRRDGSRGPGPGATASRPPAANAANAPYSDMLAARQQETQRQKEKDELAQKETLQRLAASAAAEAVRRQKEAEAEERGDNDAVPEEFPVLADPIIDEE